MERFRLAFGFVTALVLALAACAPGGQAQPPGSTSTHLPTATATIAGPALNAVPSIHTLSLGSYKASFALPGVAGIILDPAAASNDAGMPSLDFYRYSTKQVALAPAPVNNAPGGILGSAFKGDWVSYVTQNAQQGNWILWAFNVTTRERVKVDSYSEEGPGVLWGVSSWITSPTDLVWSLVTYANGHYSSKLLDFSYSSRHKQSLHAHTAMSVTPLAMNDTAILLVQGTATQGQASTWLLKRGESAPTEISKQVAGSGGMNDRYVVWGENHSQTTTLYDLTAGHAVERWAKCIRPAIDKRLQFATCLDFATSSYLIKPVPSGQALTFADGQANLGGNAQMFNGRVLWVGPNSGTMSYFDLPTQ